MLRYEGMPQRVLRIDRRIAAEHRTLADDLVQQTCYQALRKQRHLREIEAADA